MHVSLLRAPAIAAALLVVAACHNPSGDLTITSSYTGDCDLAVRVGAFDAIEQPLGEGESLVFPGLVAGVHQVVFATRGMTEGQLCRFPGTGAEATCLVYVAAGVDPAVVVGDVQPFTQPRALCADDEEETGDFDLSITPELVTVTRGQTRTVTIDVVRRGYTGEITVSFFTTTFDILANPVTIPPGATTATTIVGAGPMAPFGDATLTAQGEPAGPFSMASDTITMRVRGTGGDLDTTFAGDGTLVQEIGAADAELRDAALVAGSSAVLAAGSVGGDWLVVKILADGTLDPSFGTGGYVVIPFPGADDVATGIVEISNQSIFVTGKAGVDFTVVKLTAAGAIDTSFGSNGVATADFGGELDVATAIAGDGILYVGGTAGTSDPDMAVATFLWDTGAPYTSFGTQGKHRVSSAGIDELDALVMAPSLKAGGTRRAQPGDPRTLVVRDFSMPGPFDPVFGTGGLATGTTSASHGAMTGLTTGNADGFQYVHGGSLLTVEQVDRNGVLDGAFGTGGTTPSLLSGASARGVTHVEGTFFTGSLVTGTVGTPADTFLLRINAVGALDPAWSQGGMSTFALSSGAEQAEDVVVDVMGRYIVVGWATGPSGRRAIAAARLRP